MGEINTIKDLYEYEKTVWKEENERYIGVTPLRDYDDEDFISKSLNESADKFWNNGTCELKNLFVNHNKCNDIDKIVEGSYKLEFDDSRSIIVVSAEFVNDNNDIKRSPLAYIPAPTDLCWIINNTEYVLRITVTPNYNLIKHSKDICSYQHVWYYNIVTDEFDIRIDDYDPYESLSEQNRIYLEACMKKPLTKDNFTEALKSIPQFDKNSVLYFNFNHMEELFKIVRNSKRFANPLKRVPIVLDVNKFFISQTKHDENEEQGTFNNLVISHNKLFALENIRTVIFKSNVYNRAFSFTDSKKLFDAFKTSTNKSAGRSRLILDDVVVKDGILYNKDKDGNYIDMYNLILNDDYIVDKNLSVLSISKFSSNNDAKRIMMTAKLRAQAVPTVGEIDDLTHETPARIVFGDFEGFNYGDAIIISKSFAKKLCSHKVDKINLNNIQYSYLSNYKVGDTLKLEDLQKVISSHRYNNYRNIKIKMLTPNTLVIDSVLPFSIGDKITNLHGSKGIVCMIFDDDEMPKLKNDIGPNFKAGPFDIIVSALSVYRRKSLGQLFEAWALATGHDDVNNITDAVNNYKQELIDFSNNAVVEWHGVETIKPCGINMIIRLDHDAITKQSHSYIQSNYSNLLKFGEMELLNLGARGLYSIMNELDIRAINKHSNSISEIKLMQETGYIKNEAANNMKFFNILKQMGFDFNIRQPARFDEINPQFAKLAELIDNDIVDPFDDED